MQTGMSTIPVQVPGLKMDMLRPGVSWLTCLAHCAQTAPTSRTARPVEIPQDPNLADQSGSKSARGERTQRQALREYKAVNAMLMKPTVPKPFRFATEERAKHPRSKPAVCACMSLNDARLTGRRRFRRVPRQPG